jgi:hypothetical protein
MTQSATEGDPTAQSQSTIRATLRRLEVALIVLLSLAWIVFHLRFFLHAAALWRDEVNSVNLATSPRIADIWHNLQYDSFPMLWHLVLRAWISTGLSLTDRGIRLLGLVTGFGVLIAILFNARQFRTRPIIALTLLGFSTTVVCYGDSIRAYGPGILLALFTFTLMWRVATRPTPLNIIATLLVGLAAVHMLYYNCVITAAVCCGGIAVAAFHRQWKRAILIAGIGFVSAASMTIYAPAIHRAGTFREILYFEPSLSRIAGKFAEAVSYAPANQPQHSKLNRIVWGSTALVAIFLGTAHLFFKRRSSEDSFRLDLVTYHLTTLCVGLLGYLAFLWRLGYYMQPWYFLSILALIAICSDGLIGSSRGTLGRIFILLAATTFAAIAAVPIWRDAGLRKTAIDTDAEKIAFLVGERDLILISPWYYGVTFHRYYHGGANYLTVPPDDSRLYHNYDFLIPYMRDPHAMDLTIERVGDCLKLGHTVFLFGEFDRSKNPVDPSKANVPGKSLGSNDGDYYALWQQQIMSNLRQHSARIDPIPLDFAGVSHYERPSLFAAHGWVDSPIYQTSTTQRDTQK